MQILEKEIEGN